MGRLYVPKPPKKRSNGVAKSKIIARAVFDALSMSKTLVPVTSRQISRVCPPSISPSFSSSWRSKIYLAFHFDMRSCAANPSTLDCTGLTFIKMGPRDSRDLTETNGKDLPVGKGKGKAKISRASSNASFRDLPSEAVDAGIVAVRQISKILHFAHSYHEEISDVEGIYGVCISMQAKIDELNTTVDDLMFRKDQEMIRLRDENDAYQDNACQIERERETLKKEHASMDDSRKAMQSKMKKQKEKEISEAKQDISEKSKAKVKKIKDELEERIQDLGADKDGLKDAIKKLEEKNAQTQQDLSQQKAVLELDKRSSQSHIMRLEAQLREMNAALTVSPQTPEY